MHGAAGQKSSPRGGSVANKNCIGHRCCCSISSVCLLPENICLSLIFSTSGAGGQCTAASYSMYVPMIFYQIRQWPVNYQFREWSTNKTRQKHRIQFHSYVLLWVDDEWLGTMLRWHKMKPSNLLIKVTTLNVNSFDQTSNEHLAIHRLKWKV